MNQKFDKFGRDDTCSACVYVFVPYDLHHRILLVKQTTMDDCENTMHTQICSSVDIPLGIYYKYYIIKILNLGSRD